MAKLVAAFVLIRSWCRWNQWHEWSQCHHVQYNAIVLWYIPIPLSLTNYMDLRTNNIPSPCAFKTNERKQLNKSHRKIWNSHKNTTYTKMELLY